MVEFYVDPCPTHTWNLFDTRICIFILVPPLHVTPNIKQPLQCDTVSNANCKHDYHAPPATHIHQPITTSITPPTEPHYLHYELQVVKNQGRNTHDS